METKGKHGSDTLLFKRKSDLNVVYELFGGENRGTTMCHPMRIIKALIALEALSIFSLDCQYKQHIQGD